MSVYFIISNFILRIDVLMLIDLDRWMNEKRETEKARGREGGKREGRTEGAGRREKGGREKSTVRPSTMR